MPLALTKQKYAEKTFLQLLKKFLRMPLLATLELRQNFEYHLNHLVRQPCKIFVGRDYASGTLYIGFTSVFLNFLEFILKQKSVSSTSQPAAVTKVLDIF